jgi:hypothetical protein
VVALRRSRYLRMRSAGDIGLGPSRGLPLFVTVVAISVTGGVFVTLFVTGISGNFVTGFASLGGAAVVANLASRIRLGSSYLVMFAVYHGVPRLPHPEACRRTLWRIQAQRWRRHVQPA